MHCGKNISLSRQFFDFLLQRKSKFKALLKLTSKHLTFPFSGSAFLSELTSLSHDLKGEIVPWIIPKTTQFLQITSQYKYVLQSGSKKNYRICTISYYDLQEGYVRCADNCLADHCCVKYTTKDQINTPL